jgi:uncharacterized membrane protein required for colicin V production
MWIDLGVVAVVLLYTVIGLFQGVIVQCFRLAGLAFVVLYAKFVAESVGHWIALHLEIHPVASYYISLIAGSLILYAGCALAGRGVHRWVTGGSDTDREANRALGALLGLAKGVLVAFLLLSMLNMVPVSSLGRWPRLATQVSRSAVLSAVRPVNPLPEVRFLADIDDYKRVFENPEAQRILERQPAFIELLNLPRVREAVNDEQLREMVRENKWRDLAVNEKVLALIFDPEVRAKLNRIQPRAALEEAEKLHPKK